MVKRRRSNKVRQPVIALEPIRRSSLKVKIGDKSEAARVDGKSGAGEFRPPRHREKHTEPLNMSDVGWSGFYACLDGLWQLSEKYEVVLEDMYFVGRKRERLVAEVVLMNLLLNHVRSVRRVARLLGDPRVWGIIRDGVRDAWPDHDHRRLGETPISRDQYIRLRETFIEKVPGFSEDYRDFVSQLNVRAARWAGVGQDEDSLTYPSTRNMIVGDATWERARFNGPRAGSM